MKTILSTSVGLDTKNLEGLKHMIANYYYL